MVNVVVTADPKYPINKLAIQATVLEILQHHKIDGRVEIGINIIGDRRMHQINRQYRGIDSTTNILTFALEEFFPQNLQHFPRVGFVPSPDQVTRLGDILVSYPQALEDAGFDGISVEEEVRQLIEHGIKHLLGIHHQ